MHGLSDLSHPPQNRRTEPDPGSEPATGLRTAVNAASRPLAVKPCAYVFNAAGPETDLSFDIDPLRFIDTPSSIRFTPLRARVASAAASSSRKTA